MYPTFSPKVVKDTPYLFFTGKGGVGKTSTACATAVLLADEGHSVLIVSTDPASNLQDVFMLEIGSEIEKIPSVPGLSAVNLNPEEAAANYRDKVVGPFRDKLPASVVAQMEEQLSGACTVEIAAFDEFANLLTNESIHDAYEYIIFDTAPTGHTLRLLQLPTAWTGFLEDSTHGASCLGPLSGLAEKKTLYEATVKALSDETKTSLVLVSRPDRSAISEGERAAEELFNVGITNQMLVINGVFQPESKTDVVANALFNKQQEALLTLTDKLKNIPIYQLPYIPYPLTGSESLRAFIKLQGMPLEAHKEVKSHNDLLGLEGIIGQLTEKPQGVVMAMGKGGVGKTTVASAIAVGLALKGKKVHLTTTDPAAHLTHVLRDETVAEFLTISRINPEQEVENYRNEVLKASKHLDDEAIAYLEEDLNSPCTEEIAVFRAFSDVVERADKEFVIIDTAPTGHTLLLLDASQSYFQEIERSSGDAPESVKKLLPRLRNKEETDVIVVTLPEATPVLEASRLQADLIRAEIKPSWWVINQSFGATDTVDPVLKGRSSSEGPWIQQVLDKEAKQVALIPWLTDDIVGIEALKNIATKEVDHS
ncbi:arsenical pump-driving ATPase [Evansella sp. AB-P1]|uniref:arsenical pump-driving ATPase n=1 Tax=Evansella sp. AB-P1 TaxID=3037653 RepID=UPI00241C4833|nr:arsenical pump-driving ATPase [Evansella sp. AB-P1]MDG5788007.1 arsenical pump-driving ATPase [Evansella sp. AB-P1]